MSKGGRYPSRGRLDVLNTSEVYPSICAFDIPEVPKFAGELPKRFVAWPNRKRAEAADGLHFFVDDTRFEPVWDDVGRYQRHYKDRVVCSPDFSMYTDWPRAANLWNAYRARWTARAMAERGALVIPSVTWAGPDTYDFAFEGIRAGSAVAISAYGAKRNEKLFRAGYEAMLHELAAPRRIVVVGGTVPDWMVEVDYFPANTIADRRKAA